jgi:hypothetical protein
MVVDPEIIRIKDQQRRSWLIEFVSDFEKRINWYFTVITRLFQYTTVVDVDHNTYDSREYILFQKLRSQLIDSDRTMTRVQPK